jgi:hypothetical protein
MKLHLTLFALSLALGLRAQAPIEKTFNLSPDFDAAGKVLPTPNGNYLIFGKQREESVTYNYDFFLLMVDPLGNEIWRKSYGTPGLDESGSQGLARCAGGWVMVGSSGQNGWIVRVNEQGVVIWSKVLKVPNSSNVKLTEVAPVPSGGFVISGYEGGCSGVEMLAFKVSESGELEWVHDYAKGEASGLYVTEAGNAFIMVGENQVMKIRTSNGALSWIHNIVQTPFGAISANVRMELSDVCSLGDYGFAISGTLVSDGADYKTAYYVALGTEYGDFKWSKVYNTSVLNNTSSDITAQSSLYYLPNSQDLLVSGLVNGRIVVTRSNLQGKLLENKTIGGTGLYYQPYVLKDNDHYVVTGGIAESFSNISTWFHRSTENILSMQQGSTGNAQTPGSDQMRVFPNPASDVLHVQLPAVTDQSVVLQLQDVAGQLLRSQSVDLFKGENQFDLDLSGLPKGMFWVVVPGFSALQVLLNCR